MILDECKKGFVYFFYLRPSFTTTYVNVEPSFLNKIRHRTHWSSILCVVLQVCLTLRFDYIAYSEHEKNYDSFYSVLFLFSTY